MSNIQRVKNELVQLTNMDDMARMAKAFAASGMFSDAKDAAQAMVKIQAGAELGIPPFQAMSGVHIIKGKPAIGAGLMAAMVDSHPEYDFEVVEQNAEVCEIKFFKNGKARGTSRFTIQDAKNAGTQNLQKYAQNMLYARAMSNGVKWYCPGVFGGPVYVPEELGGDVQDIDFQPVKEPKAEKAKEEPKKEKAEAPKAEVQDAEVLEEPKGKKKAEPATVQQKSELLKLINHEMFNAAQKEKMIKKANTLDTEEIEACIAKTKEAIADYMADKEVVS